MPDKYSNHAELAAAEEEGTDFKIVVVSRPQSRVAVVAPQAGGIEPGTGPMAKSIAGAEFSLYCFRGLKHGSNRELHITSHHFDEPRCLELISDHGWVIAIHGCEKKDKRLFLTGLAKPLINDLETDLLRAGLRVETSGHNFTATHPKNICNRGESMRVCSLNFRPRLGMVILSRFS